MDPNLIDEDFEEYSQEEDELRESLEEEIISDELKLLYEAAPALLNWRKLGGQNITREMEEALIGESTIQLTPEQNTVLIRLMDIWYNLFSVAPPSSPYSQTGQILGELRRIFGKSSWVTKIPDSILQIEQLYTDYSRVCISNIQYHGCVAFSQPITI
jgi:hypothetical protein